MTLNEFVEKFASQFEDTAPEEISAECEFHELDEWSSIQGLAIIAYIQSEMGKTIPATEMRACVTVEDLWKLVESK